MVQTCATCSHTSLLLIQALFCIYNHQLCKSLSNNNFAAGLYHTIFSNDPKTNHLIKHFSDKWYYQMEGGLVFCDGE